MSEMTFEEMLEDSVKTIHNGDIVDGTVIDVKPDEIILNIGYKADGVISRYEYTNEPNADLTTMVHVGDKLTAKVMKENDGDGQVQLTYKRLVLEKGNEKLHEAFENKQPIKGTVIQVLGGGLIASVEGARVFIPASLVSDFYEKDLGKYKDQEIEFMVTEFNPRRNRVIGDRKQVLIAEKAELQKALFEKLEVGDVIIGKVKNITDFGAFIDIGGVDGLLHISEMSWGRIDNPRKILKPGEEVKVFVKNINETKVALSMKFPDENPWIQAAEKFAVGDIVTGRIVRMADFGAFVELMPGIDALLHVSQISRTRVEKPSDVLSVGEEITAKIVDMNPEARKISLSMKALEPFGEKVAEKTPDVISEGDASSERTEDAKTDSDIEKAADTSSDEPSAQVAAYDTKGEAFAGAAVGEGASDDVPADDVEKDSDSIEAESETAPEASESETAETESEAAPEESESEKAPEDVESESVPAAEEAEEEAAHEGTGDDAALLSEATDAGAEV